MRHKIYISAHPIDVQVQIKLGIYCGGPVALPKVGITIRRLADLGYTNINSVVEKDYIRFHMSKPRE